MTLHVKNGSNPVVKTLRAFFLGLGLLGTASGYWGLSASMILLPSSVLAGTCDGDGDAPDWDDQFDPRCNPPNYPKSLGGGEDSCPDSNANQCMVGQYSGNPVNNTSGNKFQQEADYSGAGPHALQIVRYYNSQSAVNNGPFGAHWSFSYGGRIEAVSASQVNVIRSDGKTFGFKLSNGAWNPDGDINSKLTAVAGGWRYTNGRDGVETYDASGKLLSAANRAGLTQTFAYDGAGRLATVTDPFGRSLAMEYDGQNRIAAITDPAGRRYGYAYDNNNNLGAVSYPDGTSRQYRYENTAFPHALTGIIDENGQRFATWSYDSQGWAVSSEHAGGAEKVTLSYDRANLKTNVKDLLGGSRLFSYRTYLGVAHTAFETQSCTNGSCSSATRSMTYDNEGNLIQSIDFKGNTTNYSYDIVRNLEISRTEAVGKPQSRTIKTTWHKRFRLPVKIVQPGRTLAFDYDDQGNLLQKTVTDTANQQSRTWTYTYNADGQPLTVDGPRTDVADVTRLAYDAQGNLSTVTDALGHVTAITDYNADGQPLSVTDPNGLISRFEYDARGRLVSVAAGTEVTRYSYDAAGNLIKATLPDRTEIGYRYDDAHRLIGISDAQGNHVDYTLDSLGNPVKTQVFDPANQLASTRTQVFDGLNRLAKTIGADNQTALYGYDANGNTTSVVDPLNHKTTLGYDALNRLISSIDPAGHATQAAYDNQDNLLSVVDPLKLATQYGYDGFGQRLSTDSPDTGNSQAGYDEAGNPLSATDARGQTVNYGYDALNRIASIAPLGQTPINFSYDQGSNGIGHLTEMTDESGTTRWAYDQHGRLTSKTFKTASLELTTRYGYDAGGRLISLTYPSGQVVKLGYDGNGRVSRLEHNRKALLSDIRYQSFGAARSWTFGNGVGTRRSFDLDGRLIAYDLGDRSRQLSYDAAGRITGYTDSDVNHDQSFGYDELDRLISYTDANGQSLYSYGANGNRLQQTDGVLTKNFNQDAASNQLQSITDGNLQTLKSYNYDAAGHLTSDGYNQFAYDGRGRLVQVSNIALGVQQYRINGLGQRVAKTKGSAAKRAGSGDDDDEDGEHHEDGHKAHHGKAKGVQNAAAGTYFVYDEAGHLLGEYSHKGKAIQETVWLGNMPVAVLKNQRAYYVYADHLNSPRVITGRQGQVVWRWDSDPFGVGQATAPVKSTEDGDDADEDADGDGKAFVYNLRFPGQYYDQETGLHYNTFRDYDPVTGRYIQSDPIGLSGGINTYAYVHNNPLSWIDPSGLDSVLIFQTEPDWQKSQSPAAWNNAASYAGGQALNSCANCSPNDIHVIPVNDVGQVNSALSNFSDIAQIYFIGHSSSSSIYVGSQNLRNTNISNNGGANDVSPSKLNWSNLKSDASINILGCNAGKGNNSIAQQISNASGRATTAPNQFLNFDEAGKPFFRPWRSGSFNTFFPNQ